MIKETKGILIEEFIKIPIIERLSRMQRWTFTSAKDKKPVNLISLKNYLDGNEKYIRGSRIQDEGGAMSVLDIKRLFNVDIVTPMAFYQSAMFTDVMIVDIEPKCDEELKNKLLTLPYIYAERSLSGNGIHLILPIPEKYKNDNLFMNSKSLNQGGHFEILLNQWCTFTGDYLEVINNSEISQDEVQINLNEFIDEFLKTRKEKVEVERKISLENPVLGKLSDDHGIEKYNEFKKNYEKTIPSFKSLVKFALNKPYNKTRQDFINNNAKGEGFSEWEYGNISYYFNRVVNQLNWLSEQQLINIDEFDETKLTYIVYSIIEQVIPYRDKHSTKRNGVPLLLNSLIGIYEKNKNDINYKYYDLLNRIK